MDLSSANQLASFVRWHRDKRLWILDEDGTLDVGLYPGRIERSRDWSVISISAGVEGPDRIDRILRLDRIAAVKVEVSDDEARYFGDRRRMVEVEVGLCLEAARHEDSAGRYEAALARSQESLDLVAPELGSGHRLYPHALASAADALRRLGRFAEAEERAQVACTRARALLDPGDPILAGILQVAACLYVDTGELERARIVAHEVLDLLRASPRRAEMAEALATLSLIECRRGRFAEAERLAGDGLALLATAAGSATRARLRHHAGMASCLAGRLEAGRRLLVESLDERRRLLGESHPETIESTASLGTLHLIAGESDLAVSLYRKVLAQAESTHGPDHIRVADYAVNLAVALRNARGREARIEAMGLLERSRRIRRMSVG